MQRLLYISLTATILLAGCGHRAETYTLYRTSSAAPGLRVHFSTFDANEPDPNYNLANCQMAARLLTANMKALNGEDYNPSMGFWCEPGLYSRSGETPGRFSAAFPTDTP